MAIDRGTARLLLSELAKRPFQGALLQLGRQTILFNQKQLQLWAKQAGVTLKPGAENSQKAQGKMEDSLTAQLDDIRFFRLLGFDEATSCDVSSYENATFALDLNRQAPPELHGRFDCVFNGGTMEHVFDVPAVLANIHSLSKVGGRAIHIAPSSNMVDHGFYSLSPTLFRDYYRANQYQVLAVHLFKCLSWSGEWTVYDYMAGTLDNRLGRIANPKMAGVFCVVEKTARSTSDVVPAQSYFSRLWQTAPNRQGIGWLTKLRQTIKSRCPELANLFLSVRALVWRASMFRRISMPPLIGKY